MINVSDQISFQRGEEDGEDFPSLCFPHPRLCCQCLQQIWRWHFWNLSFWEAITNTNTNTNTNTLQISRIHFLKCNFLRRDGEIQEVAAEARRKRPDQVKSYLLIFWSGFCDILRSGFRDSASCFSRDSSSYFGRDSASNFGSDSASDFCKNGQQQQKCAVMVK